MTGPPGRIRRVTTLRHPDYRNLLHVELTTIEGAVGLGETLYYAGAVETHIHEVLAPRLLAAPSSAPDVLRELCSAGFYGSPRPAGPVSVETAAASALDVAAWDLAARGAGSPLAALVPGAAERAEVATYNTCCDPDHDWLMPGAPRYRDFTASLQDPEGLAEDLAAAGYRLMKVWPPASFGVAETVAWAGRVAGAAGSKGLDVALDLYGRFAPDEAAAVAAGLDGAGLAWIEDPLPSTDGRALAEFRRGLHTPVCAGEALAGAGAYETLVRDGGVSLLHYDVAWGGGVSGALEAAAVAAAHGIPITFHDCSGPVTWATGAHLACRLGHAAHIESVRTLVYGPYPAIADGAPVVAAGLVRPDGPGHGCTLTAAYRSGCRAMSTG